DLGRRTRFDSLDGSLAITNGGADIHKLDFRTPLLRVTQGKPASIDLVDGTLDLMVNARVVKVGGGENEVDLSVLRGMVVPVHVAGPLKAPQFEIVWDQMGGSMVRNAIQHGLLDLIDQQCKEQ